VPVNYLLKYMRRRIEKGVVQRRRQGVYLINKTALGGYEPQ
jgi:hypothetical protein